MKQILRIASVFALAGAALLYTGCAKDYSEDIKAVKTDLQKLQDGTVADHTKQIASLEQSVKDLQKIDADLKAADEQIKKDLAQAKSDLEKADSENKKLIDENAKLIADNQKDNDKKISDNAKLISDNAKLIKDLQDEIKTLEGADSTLVEKIDANKLLIEELTKTVEANKEAAETLVKNLKDGEVKANAEAISGLKTTVENNKKAAEEALTNLINGQVKTNSDSIAILKGIIEANATAAEASNKLLNDSLNHKISLNEAAIVLNQGAISNLESWCGNLQTSVNSLGDEINAIKAKMLQDSTVLAGRLDAVEATASTAAQNAETALGDIETIKKVFGTYYYEGGIDALKAYLEGRIDRDSIRINNLENEVALLKSVDASLSGRIVADSIRLEILKAQASGADAELYAQIKRDSAAIELLKSQCAALQQKDADLYAQIKADSTDIEDLKVKAGELNQKDNLLDQRIDTLSNYVNEALKSLAHGDSLSVAAIYLAIQGVQDDVDDLRNNEIAPIKTQISELINKDNELQGQITDLGLRVASISVCPTKIPEIQPITVGDTTVVLFRGTFEVEPISTAKNIKKEDLTLTYAFGVSRSNFYNTVPGNVEYKTATIDSIVVDNAGRVLVFAKGLAKKNRPAATQNDYRYFFALTYSGTDKTGSYTSTSDYAEAIEAKIAIDIKECFGFIAPSPGGGSLIITGDYTASKDTLDYKKADTAKFVPFKDYSLIVDLDKVSGVRQYIPIPKSYLSVKETMNWLNLDDSLVCVKTCPNPSVAPLAVTPKDSFNDTVSFKPAQGKSMYEYVSTSNYYCDSLRLSVKNVLTHSLISKYMITKVQHAIVTLKPLHLYWNYKHYTPDTRIDTMIVSDATWQESKLRGGKDSFISFQGKQSNEIFFGQYNWTTEVYPDSLFMIGQAKINKNGYTGETTLRDTIKRSSESDDYYFEVVATADPALKNQGRKHYITIPGTITRDTYIPVKGIARDIVDKNFAALVHGLEGKDATDSAAFKAVSERIYQQVCTLKFDGQPNGVSCTSRVIAKDSLSIKIDAGKLNYNKTYQLILTFTDIFGFEYADTLNIQTEAAPFRIKNKAWIVNKVGTVRGALKDSLVSGKMIKVYTIEDLDYNKQVEFEITDTKKFNEDLTKLGILFAGTRDNSKSSTYSGNFQITTDKIGVQSDKKSLVSHAPMTWYKYDQLKIKMSAQIYFGTIQVNESELKYELVTDKPVKMDVTGGFASTINAQKLPAVPLHIPLHKDIKVYGIVNGQFDTNTNLIDTTGVNVNPLYGNVNTTNYNYTKLVISVGNELDATLNGQSCKLVRGVDYEWVTDGNTYGSESTPRYFDLIIIKDNLKGVLTIDVPVKLNYYLDYKHTNAESAKVRVIVNQN